MSDDTRIIPLPWLRDRLEERLMDIFVDCEGRLMLDTLSADLVALLYVGVQLRLLAAGKK